MLCSETLPPFVAMSDFVEDISRRRCISISSCSSDPLQYRHEVGTTSLCSGASSLYSDGGSDDSARVPAPPHQAPSGVGLTKDALEQVGDARDSKAGSISSMGSRAPRTKRVAVEPTDMVDVPIKEGEEADVSPTHVSPRPFAFIESVIPRGHTVVGVHAEEGSIVSTGAVVCLADGRFVGRVVTVLGQVTSCRYAIVSSPSHFASLLMSTRDTPLPVDLPEEEDGVPVPEYLRSSLIAMGTHLHFDTSSAEVIYDPATNVSRAGGTDASFVDDEPLPDTARPDFSDDEEERKWKSQRRQAIHEKKTKAAVAPHEECVAEGEDMSISSSESEASFNESGEIIAYAARPTIGKKRTRPARQPRAAEWGHAQVLGQQAGLVPAVPPPQPPAVPRPGPPKVTVSHQVKTHLVYKAPL